MDSSLKAQYAMLCTGSESVGYYRAAEKQSLREFGRKRDEHTGLFLCNIVVKTG